MRNLPISTHSHEHSFTTTLDRPPVNSQTSWAKIQDTTLELGLLKSAGGSGMVEALKSPGYARQPSPRWSISSSGELVNLDPVKFDVAFADASPLRLIVYSDGKAIMSGTLTETGRSYAMPGSSSITFKRGSLRFRTW